MQPALPAKIDTVTARFGPSLQAIVGRLLRMVAIALVTLCALIFGCDLSLDRTDLGGLFITSVAAMCLFWIGGKIGGSAERTAQADNDAIPQMVCRRRPLLNTGTRGSHEVAIHCRCRPWQCELKRDQLAATAVNYAAFAPPAEPVVTLPVTREQPPALPSRGCL